MSETVEKLASIVLTFLLSSLGICAYVLFIYLIYKYGQERFSNSFYALALSFAFSDLYRLLQGIIVSLPILIIDLRSGEDGGAGRFPKWYRTVTGFLSTAAWLATVSHMLALAVNRLTAVYWPAKYKRLYNNTKCAAILLACYFYAVFASSLILFGGCRAEFVGYSWRIVTSDGLPLTHRQSTNQTQTWPHSQCSEGVRRMNDITTKLLIIFTVAVDLAAVIGVLIYKRKLNARFRHRILPRLTNQQWSLTAQFTVTVALLLASVSVDWIAPVLVRNGIVSSNMAAIFVNISSLCSSTLTPITYIICGSMVRRQVFGLYKNGSQQNVTGNGSYMLRRENNCLNSTC